MTTSVVLTIVVLISTALQYVLLLRPNGTASVNGSGDDFGQKFGDGIITDVFSKYFFNGPPEQ